MTPYRQLTMGFLSKDEPLVIVPNNESPPFIPDNTKENEPLKKEVETFVRIVKMLDKKYKDLPSADYSDIAFDLYIQLGPKIKEIKTIVTQLSEKHNTTGIKNIFNSTTAF